MFSQRLIVRLTQTAILSGLTIIYYTALRNNPYFSVFVLVIVLIFLVILIRAIVATRDTNADKLLNRKIDDLHHQHSHRPHSFLLPSNEGDGESKDKSHNITLFEAAPGEMVDQEDPGEPLPFDEYLMNAEASELEVFAFENPQEMAED